MNNYNDTYTGTMKEYISTKIIPVGVITDIINASYQCDIDLKQIRDSLSLGQLASKLWLDEYLFDFLPEENVDILIVGGWIGSLSRILLESFNEYFSKTQFHITSLDIDPVSTKIARIVNEKFFDLFTAVTRNMYDLKPEDYNNHSVVINTSCEHILNVQKWSDVIPPGTLVVGQSNDFFSCPQHCNCVRSIEELGNQLNLSEILYDGSMKMDGMYTRFMVIGVK